jgi:hypothetical protein
MALDIIAANASAIPETRISRPIFILGKASAEPPHPPDGLSDI